MNNTAQHRWNFQMPVVLLTMFGVITIEFITYRLMGNLGLFIGTSGTGVVAKLASGALIMSGLLITVTLFFYLAHLLNSSQIHGVGWRWTIIVTSPAYLLGMLWSIFVPLSSFILMISYIILLLNIAIVLFMSASRPAVPGTAKHLLMLIGVTVVFMYVSWFTLYFFNMSRFTALGKIGSLAYRVSEVLAFLVAVHAALQALHLPKKRILYALAAAAAICAGAVAIVIHFFGGTEVFVTTNQLLLGFMIRTTGFELTWPYGLTTAMGALFIASATVFAHLFSYRQNTYSLHMGIGLFTFWMAGLLPFSVYQNTMLFLGVLLLAHGYILRFPNPKASEDYESFESILKELDDSPSGQ